MNLFLYSCFIFSAKGFRVQKKLILIWVLLFKWSGKQDLNLQPLGPKPSALPNWAISRYMVRPIGVEPITFWSVVKRSIQLIYERITYRMFNNLMVAPAGIEPATQGFSVPCSTDWAMEPKKMAVPTRIELAIFCVTGRRDNRYTTGPNGCGGKIWTYDLRVMSPTSYQTAPLRDIK